MEYVFLKLVQLFKVVVKSTERADPFQIMVQIMVKSSNIEVLNIKWFFIGFILLEIVLTVIFVWYMRNYMWRKHIKEPYDNFI